MVSVIYFSTKFTSYSNLLYCFNRFDSVNDWTSCPPHRITNNPMEYIALKFQSLLLQQQVRHHIDGTDLESAFSWRVLKRKGSHSKSRKEKQREDIWRRDLENWEGDCRTSGTVAKETDQLAYSHRLLLILNASRHRQVFGRILKC